MRKKKEKASAAADVKDNHNIRKPVNEIRVREVRFDEEATEQYRESRNTELGIVTYTFVLLFLVLIGYLTYLNIFKVSDQSAVTSNS